MAQQLRSTHFDTVTPATFGSVKRLVGALEYLLAALGTAERADAA